MERFQDNRNNEKTASILRHEKVQVGIHNQRQIELPSLFPRPSDNSLVRCWRRTLSKGLKRSNHSSPEEQPRMLELSNSEPNKHIQFKDKAQTSWLGRMKKSMSAYRTLSIPSEVYQPRGRLNDRKKSTRPRPPSPYPGPLTSSESSTGSTSTIEQHVQFILPSWPKRGRKKLGASSRRAPSPYPHEKGMKSNNIHSDRFIHRRPPPTNDDDDEDDTVTHPGLFELVLTEEELGSKAGLDKWIWQTRSYDYQALHEHRRQTKSVGPKQNRMMDSKAKPRPHSV